MANPTPYERGYSFAGFQTNNPQKPLPGQKVDEELDNLERTTTELISGLAEIRRSDGALRNGIVTKEALAPGITTGLDPAVEWTPSTQFFVNATVFYGTAFYRCLETHISSADFATDLAAGKWEKYADIGGVADDAAAARDEAVLANEAAQTAKDTAVAAAGTASADAATASAAATTATTARDEAVDARDEAVAAAETATEKAATVINGFQKRVRYSAADGNLTAGQTVFTVTGGYDPQEAEVIRNGYELVNGVDVDVSSGTTFTLTVGVGGSDVIVFKAFGVFNANSKATAATPDTDDEKFSTPADVVRRVVANAGVFEEPTDLAAYLAASEARVTAGDFVILRPGRYALSADLDPAGGAILQAPNAFIEGPEKVLGSGFYTADTSGNPYPAVPNMWKFKDRVFIGDAADYNGAETKAVMIGTGPYSGSTYATRVADLLWLERDATFHASSPEGMIGVLGTTATARRSGYFDDARQRTSIGVAALALNDRTDGSTGGWAGYFEGVVNDNGPLNTRGVYGVEIAVKDRRSGGGPIMHPFAGTGSMSVGIWLAGGADAATGGLPGGPSSGAIAIGKNGESWHKGIIFTAEGIEGADGFTGSNRGRAIEGVTGQEYGWRDWNRGRDNSSSGAYMVWNRNGSPAYTFTRYENNSVFLGSKQDATERTGLQIRTPAATNKAISGATQANPVVITSTAHGYSNGDRVKIVDVVGMEELNGNVYTVANVAANTYELSGVDGTAFGAYGSAGNGYKVVEAVNFLIVDAVATGGRVQLNATGSDTNVGLVLKPKAAESVIIQDGNGNNKLNVNNTGLGFYGTNGTAKQSITGSRGGNAALADLLTKLATIGLITDATTA